MGFLFRIAFIFALILSVGKSYAFHPDLPRHFKYRDAVFQSLADEIINSATRQDKILFRNDVIEVLQAHLNPVFDNVVMDAKQYEVCTSTNEECINAEWAKVESMATAKIENNFFNFYNYQNRVWSKIYIAPKKGWNLLNEWYPSFINLHFGLDADSLIGENTNAFYLNTRVMFYRLKEEMYPAERHISKSLFSAYYNHCVYILKQPSIISYEFFQKMNEVDSIMTVAADVNTGDALTRTDIANVYIALAFNDNFPAGIEKNEMVNMFLASDRMLKKALSYNESGKVHYALGALYNNFLVDYNNQFSSEEKLNTFDVIVPAQIDEESTDHLDRACLLDPEYCNLRKFKVR